MNDGTYREHGGSRGTSSNPADDGSGFAPGGNGGGGGGDGGGDEGGFQGLMPPPMTTITVPTSVPMASTAAGSANSATATLQALGTTTAAASNGTEGASKFRTSYAAAIIGVLVILFVLLVPASFLLYRRYKRKRNHRRSIGGLSLRSADLPWWKQQQQALKPKRPWWNTSQKQENKEPDMQSLINSNKAHNYTEVAALQKPSSIHRSFSSRHSSRSISVLYTSMDIEARTPPIPTKNPRRSESILRRPGSAVTRSSQIAFPHRATSYESDVYPRHRSEFEGTEIPQLARSKSEALPKRTMSDQSHIHPALRTNFVSDDQRPVSMPEREDSHYVLSEREKQLLKKYKGPIRFGMGVQKRMSVESIFPLRPAPGLTIASADVLIGIVDSTKEEVFSDDETVKEEETKPGGFVV